SGNHSFREVSVPAFTENAAHEEVDAVFFDADGDGDQDLYVVSGGSEFGSDLEKFADRLYINEGMSGDTINFSLSDGLPSDYTSESCVRPADFDNDGDMDLFVGGRSVPGEYGKPANSYLLENDGKGNFSDVTSKYMTQVSKIGMVTDAVWSDYDNDEDLDLIVVGDWMPITIFENRGDFFQRQFDVPGLGRTEGWWESIAPADLNGDGNMDFITGNLGTNSMFKASEGSPVKLYVNDFDRNGSLDHVYAFKQEDRFIPYHLKKPMGRQLSFIEAKFPKFEDYADKSMSEIFSKEQLDNALQLTAYQLHSVAVINNGDGTFSIKKLPKEAQYAPVFDTATDDFDRDSRKELLLTGNFSGTRPREGFYLANHGALFDINEDGSLTNIDYSTSGLWIRGDVRDTEIIKTNTGKLLVIGKNDGQTEIYAYD
ncbi:MAG TPA: VCBS repeat-containing protein, partial [Bacteroidales bacterium]|nr:VCBS repeat-containing protein [Bacteroidales bacterium]